MRYTVVLTPQAERELDEAADWWAVHRSAEDAERWYLDISREIDRLDEDPFRWAPAWENDDFPYEIRELHFGLGSRSTHRAVYTIVESFVIVFTLRHAAQDRLMPDDIEFK